MATATPTGFSMEATDENVQLLGRFEGGQKLAREAFNETMEAKSKLEQEVKVLRKEKEELAKQRSELLEKAGDLGAQLFESQEVVKEIKGVLAKLAP